jgi:hypothetical protein
MLGGSSFETAEEPQEKATDIFMSIAMSIFRAVFEERKSRLLRHIKASGEYLSKHPFSTVCISQEEITPGQDFPHLRNVFCFNLAEHSFIIPTSDPFRGWRKSENKGTELGCSFQGRPEVPDSLKRGGASSIRSCASR